MGKGKIAAQASHASLGAYLKTVAAFPNIARDWLQMGQGKVVLKADNEKMLLDFFMTVKTAKIPCELIADAGRTQIESGTKTALGVGPYEEKKLDEIFGKLKLL